MRAKGSFPLLVLDALLEVPGAALDALFSKSRVTARTTAGRTSRRATQNISRQSLSVILYRLHNEGLVEKRGSTRNARWYITAEGEKALRQQDIVKRQILKSDGVLRIVSFDIPEPERKKRRWLRELLIDCNYKPIQKSVWLGTVPLPENFIEDLELMRLRDCIHIFSIDKKGTLLEKHYSAS